MKNNIITHTGGGGLQAKFTRREGMLFKTYSSNKSSRDWRFNVRLNEVISNG